MSNIHLDEVFLLKLSLARALYSESDVYLFDDVFITVDSETER